MLKQLTAITWLLGFSAPLLAQVCPPHMPPPVAPDGRYSVAEPVAGETVVTDIETGLMWKQCPEGFSGPGCASGSLLTLNFVGALAAAEGSGHAGFSDWRLPNLTELDSLVETSCFDPAINTRLFPNNGSGNLFAAGLYWTSTIQINNQNTVGAGEISFFSGQYRFISVGSSVNRRVRLVRGGAALESFDAAGDFTPDPFEFVAQTDVPLGALRVSNAISVSGIDTPVGIGVSGAADSTYSINGGPFVSTPGAVVNGDSVVLRHTSAATPETMVTSTLRIGALSADFVTTTRMPTYSIGGTLSGLAAGASVVLRNNGGDDLSLGSNGAFTFATELVNLSPYAVTVFAQPTNPPQTCTVSNGSGTLAGANVSNVGVNCVTNTYTVTPSASAGGSITPATPQTVTHGDTTSFSLAAQSGFYLEAVGGSCGGSLVGSTYTTAPVVADCSVQAQFAPRIASTALLAATPNPARLGQAVLHTITVSGGSFAPADGQVTVTASSGESCSDTSPQVSGLQSTFACSISYATLGPRMVTASFSGSVTHLDATSAALALQVARLADLSVSIDDGQNLVRPGAEVGYLVEVRNAGPDDAPASLVVLAATPALDDSSWSCTPVGAAVCPSAGGSGEFSAGVDLPAGAGLDVVQIGTAPPGLSGDLVVQVAVSADGQAPNFVIDPDPGNNQAADVNDSDRIFMDGFE